MQNDLRSLVYVHDTYELLTWPLVEKLEERNYVEALDQT